MDGFPLNMIIEMWAVTGTLLLSQTRLGMAQAIIDHPKLMGFPQIAICPAWTVAWLVPLTWLWSPKHHLVMGQNPGNPWWTGWKNKENSVVLGMFTYHILVINGSLTQTHFSQSIGARANHLQHIQERSKIMISADEKPWSQNHCYWPSLI